MPVRYQINSQLEVVLVTAEGHITSKELFSYIRPILADPAYTLQMKYIMDLRYASVDFELSDIYEVIQLSRDLNAAGYPPRPTAIISVNQGVYIMGETINILAHAIKLQFTTCQTLPEAIHFLNLTAHQAAVSEFIEQQAPRP